MKVQFTYKADKTGILFLNKKLTFCIFFEILVFADKVLYISKIVILIKIINLTENLMLWYCIGIF